MTSNMIMRVEGNELVLERTFQAPKSLVFKAFTEPEQLKQWWGPRGWTVTECTLDLQPGGFWHYCMKCVDENLGDFFGMESWGKGVYEEVRPEEYFSYTDYFSDAEGMVNKELPSSFIMTTFKEQDGATKVLNRSRYGSPEELQTVLDMGMEEGIRQTWDRLEEYLAARS
ncbi:SRPBCC domain-containing protein [Paenibacillus herberti]|uniref:ATPase n=1 Tax=Paenibacillus herberti TaxID=1619309 RepID=A0A229NTW6_9BACL|nr:SRPBCC domain-containing protein [Paenibacillus herberti]OXM13351.1 ATPase [Paenibacillus herberti]